MPTYEYQCLKCKSIIELQQKVSERIPPVCCKDGCNIEMEQILSTTSFSLRGSGWAADGYSSKK